MSRIGVVAKVVNASRESNSLDIKFVELSSEVGNVLLHRLFVVIHDDLDGFLESITNDLWCRGSSSFDTHDFHLGCFVTNTFGVDHVEHIPLLGSPNTLV